MKRIAVAAVFLLVLGIGWPGSAGPGKTLLAAASAAEENADDAQAANRATDLLREIMSIPEKGMPPALLRRAQGIAIIPNVVKAGFVLGGRYGTGVVLVRGRDGAWGTPLNVSITSGSIGWQIGVQATDVILVFKTRKSVDGLLNGKFTLGADANVAAGPVGRHAEAATDVRLKAEVYAYSRSRGLFAGVSLEGSVLSVGRRLSAPKAVGRLKTALAKYARP